MSNALPQTDYHLPASLHPMLMVACAGELSVWRGAGRQRIPRISLCGPTRTPQLVSATAGTRLLTVSIQPGQLQRLVEPHAWAVRDQCVDLHDAVHAREHDALWRLETGIETAASRADEAQALWSLLAELHQSRAARPRDIVLPRAWASTSARHIAAQSKLGLRQFERRFLTSHGQTLRGFMQQARCSQALGELLRQGAQNVTWAERALDWGYCDQSHLHRDLVRFTGFTPTRLASGVAARDLSLWPYLAAQGRSRQLFGPIGY